MINFGTNHKTIVWIFELERNQPMRFLSCEECERQEIQHSVMNIVHLESRGAELGRHHLAMMRAGFGQCLKDLPEKP